MHEDHIHILFNSSPTNSMRGMRKILDQFEGPLEKQYEVKATEQLRNVGNFLR